MPTKREIDNMGPAEREFYEEEREARAARKRFRTNWRTDATETEKETALHVALNQIGGRKKYAWLETGPKTVAETLGQKRAIELGIRTGKLAEELKIGEHRDEQGPQNLVVNWEDLRSAGINMSREEFEQSLRDAGTPEEEIQAAISPKSKKIVGRSAASVRGGSKASSGEKKKPTPAPKKTPPTPKTPTNKRGKKRAAEEDGDNDKGATKKRKTAKITTPKSVGLFMTPPASTSPEAYGYSWSNAISLLDDRPIPLSLPSPATPYRRPVLEPETEPQFAPCSPAISELEDLLDNEIASQLAPTSPTVDELEALLDDELAPKFAPASPTVDELEALLENEITSQSVPSSPTIDELEAVLDDEITSSSPDTPEPNTFLGNEPAPEFAPSSPTMDELETMLDDATAALFAPSSPAISELEALLDDETNSQFAPSSPTIDELEALLDNETAPGPAPSSPAISEPEGLLDGETEPQFAPSSPAISDLEALLDEELAPQFTAQFTASPTTIIEDEDDMSEEE